MNDETFTQVLEVYRKMGVKSCCIAGGGDSLVNPRTEEYLAEIVKVGTQVGIITNGRIYRKMPAACRFVNVSVNAANGKTYKRMCGVERKRFSEVCENIRQWVMDGQNVTYKVMITDRNMSPSLLVDSVKVADSLGVKSVLFRFAMLPWDKLESHKEFIQLTEQQADLYEAHTQILQRHYPHIYLSMPIERYDRYSQKKVPKRCTGGAINFVTLWNGDCCLCSSQRSNPYMKLCHISEFEETWGSQRHKLMLKGIDPNQCGRCPFYMHDKVVNEFVYEDVCNQFFI